MKWLWLAASVAVVVLYLDQAQAQKPSQFKPYTKSAKGCACWWDLTRDDCACCKPNMNAVQCGFPMHKYCFKKSKMGCPGVPQRKWTLSGKGHSCYWKKNRSKECAWCAPGGYQCGPNTRVNKLGSHCMNGKNVKYCDSVVGDCRHISKACDPNAECVKDKKYNKNLFLYKCKCKDGYTGNGVQCFDADGNLSVDPNQMVELNLTLSSDYYVYPHESGQFPLGPGIESLVTEMDKVANECTDKACSASFSSP